MIKSYSALDFHVICIFSSTISYEKEIFLIYHGAIWAVRLQDL
jgi:hypothetical protein